MKQLLPKGNLHPFKGKAWNNLLRENENTYNLFITVHLLLLTHDGMGCNNLVNLSVKEQQKIIIS